jgi:hypothetical protein
MNDFTLQSPGDPAPCSFPRCTLEAFHDGEHHFPAPETHFPLASQYTHVCCECRRRFSVLGESAGEMTFHTCGSPECLLAYARRTSTTTLEVTCRCAQRPYPHELSIHHQLRPESYNPRQRGRWPWSLCLSPRLELSAELRLDTSSERNAA